MKLKKYKIPALPNSYKKKFSPNKITIILFDIINLKFYLTLAVALTCITTNYAYAANLRDCKEILANANGQHPFSFSVPQKKISPHMSIGTFGKLSYANESIDVFFLGRLGDKTLFYDHNSKIILETSLPIITSHSSNSLWQKIPEILKQCEDDCAAHAMYNGLTFLVSSDAPMSQTLKYWMTSIEASETIKKFNSIVGFTRYINEHKERRRRGAFFSPPLQKTKRAQLLRSEKVQFKETNSIRELIKHLEEGHVAIIDTCVKHSSLYVFNTSEQQKDTYVACTKEDPEALGGHSVLAVGFLKTKPTGWFTSGDGEIVILDSAHGWLSLYPKKELQKSMTDFKTVVLLLQLGPKIENLFTK